MEETQFCEECGIEQWSEEIILVIYAQRDINVCDSCYDKLFDENGLRRPYESED